MTVGRLFDFIRFWHEQAEWSEKTFGTTAERGPVGPLKHLQKEVKEILDKPEDGEEYVDAFFLIIDAARRSKQFAGPADFLKQGFAKLEKNKLREWQVPTNPDEAVEHVRESGNVCEFAPLRCRSCEKDRLDGLCDTATCLCNCHKHRTQTDHLPEGSH